MNLRTEPLEWARRASADGLPGLGWVEGDLSGPDMSAVPAPDGELRFRGPHPRGLIPGPMLDAAIEAQQAGELPLAEVIMALLARPAWLTACRELLWSPLSPTPALLEERVEAAGISVELHRHDPDRLACLTARLPAWQPGRGTVTAALGLLERALGEEVRCRVLAGDQASASELDAELVSARSGAWWAARLASNARAVWRVEQGFLRATGLSGCRAPREDVFVILSRGQGLPTGLLRLLPAGITLRLGMDNHEK